MLRSRRRCSLGEAGSSAAGRGSPDGTSDRHSLGRREMNSSSCALSWSARTVPCQRSASPLMRSLNWRTPRRKRSMSAASSCSDTRAQACSSHPSVSLYSPPQAVLRRSPTSSGASAVHCVSKSSSKPTMFSTFSSSVSRRGMSATTVAAMASVATTAATRGSVTTGLRSLRMRRWAARASMRPARSRCTRRAHAPDCEPKSAKSLAAGASLVPESGASDRVCSARMIRATRRRSSRFASSVDASSSGGRLVRRMGEPLSPSRGSTSTTLRESIRPWARSARSCRSAIAPIRPMERRWSCAGASSCRRTSRRWSERLECGAVNVAVWASDWKDPSSATASGAACAARV